MSEAAFRHVRVIGKKFEHASIVLDNRGKRGGYRYLYLYLQDRRHIHLLILLDKNEQEDASEEQRRQTREWVAVIKKLSGG
jgi:hypothetical protein